MKAENTTLLLPRTVFETAADKDIEFEGNLADYLPGINRIVRAEANVCCEEAELIGGKAEVKGKAVFCLLYESDYKGKLKSERFTLDFSHRFDVGELPEGNCFPIVKSRCSYVSCKTLNPRRLMLRCRADLGLEIKCMQKVEVVSAADCKGAFFKKENHTVAEYRPTLHRDFGLQESLSLEGLPPVAEIVYTSLSFSAPQISLSEGSALVRCNGRFKCLYEEESEEGRIKFAEKSFTASFTVDDECIKEDSLAEATVDCVSCSAQREMDGYGENRIINFSGSVGLHLNCEGKQTVTLPTDMFFEDWRCENANGTLVAEKSVLPIQHKFYVEKTVEIPELQPELCLDTNAEVSVSETAVSDDGITVKGVCAMNILCKCGESYRAHDMSLNFAETIGEAGVNKETRYKALAEVTSATAEISGGGQIRVRVSGEIRLGGVSKKQMTALVGSEVSKREPEEDPDGARPIIIYYPEKGESAWDIGKRYHIDPQAVIAANPAAFGKDEIISSKSAVLFV